MDDRRPPADTEGDDHIASKMMEMVDDLVHSEGEDDVPVAPLQSITNTPTLSNFPSYQMASESLRPRTGPESVRSIQRKMPRPSQGPLASSSRIADPPPTSTLQTPTRGPPTRPHEPMQIEDASSLSPRTFTPSQRPSAPSAASSASTRRFQAAMTEQQRQIEHRRTSPPSQPSIDSSWPAWTSTTNYPTPTFLKGPGGADRLLQADWSVRGRQSGTVRPDVQSSLPTSEYGIGNDTRSALMNALGHEATPTSGRLNKSRASPSS